MNPKQVQRMLVNMTDEELMRLSPMGMTKNRSPHPRQAEFLGLTCEEALYGGAAGGGKTDALLMWLAEGVNVPGYSAIFFRRTYAVLGALCFRRDRAGCGTNRNIWPRTPIARHETLGVSD